MVWVRINIDGWTDLCVIQNGTWTAQEYIDKILRPHIGPYFAAIANSFLLMHDNARPYASRLVENFLKKLLNEFSV